MKTSAVADKLMDEYQALMMLGKIGYQGWLIIREDIIKQNNV